MRVLKEFWYGNIEPTEYVAFSHKDYHEALKVITHNEEILLIPE